MPPFYQSASSSQPPGLQTGLHPSPEAFISYIKLALLVGTAASLPVLLHQTWFFIAPGLHKNEKRLVITVVFWASFLFCCGASFAFFVVLPLQPSKFTLFTQGNKTQHKTKEKTVRSLNPTHGSDMKTPLLIDLASQLDDHWMGREMAVKALAPISHQSKSKKAINVV